MRSTTVGGSAGGVRGALPPLLSGEAPRWQRVLAVMAATLQVVVVASTFASGMLWTGGLYLVATGAAVLGLALVLLIGMRTGRPTAIIALLALPLASIGLILSLADLHERRLAQSACSNLELKAVAGLESPSGEPLVFRGTSDGCGARVSGERSSDELTAVFAKTLRAAGWTVTSPDGGRMAEKEGVTLFVEPLSESIEEREVVGFTGILISVNDDPEP